MAVVAAVEEPLVVEELAEVAPGEDVLFPEEPEFEELFGLLEELPPPPHPPNKMLKAATISMGRNSFAADDTLMPDNGFSSLPPSLHVSLQYAAWVPLVHA
ncbi:MAG: hypothetical protein ACR2GU_11515 [Rubrobacteraceae bacterium]